jgi:hypothetical protein
MIHFFEEFPLFFNLQFSAEIRAKPEILKKVKKVKKSDLQKGTFL